MWAGHEERPVKPGGKIRRHTEGGFASFHASRRIVTRFRRVTVWIDDPFQPPPEPPPKLSFQPELDGMRTC